MKKLLIILLGILVLCGTAWAGTKTFDDLVELTSGVSTDQLVIDDVSAGETKKIYVGTLLAPGDFTLGASGTTDETISNAYVTANSQILLFPTNAAAATLQSATSAVYVSTQVADTSFTVTTADGNTFAGTETFDYVVLY